MGVGEKRKGGGGWGGGRERERRGKEEEGWEGEGRELKPIHGSAWYQSADGSVGNIGGGLRFEG